MADEHDQPHEHAPTRVCRHCSTQSQTDGEFCPHCGKSFTRRRRRLGRRARLVLVGILVLLVGGGGTAVGLKAKHDSDVKAKREQEQRTAARIAAAEKAEQREREERERREEERKQEALDDIERASRRELEKGLRRAVTKHAREYVGEGLLEGPILKSVCDPVGGGRDDLEAKTGKYECMAVNEERGDGTYRGYSYNATINYDKFTYSWKLGD